MLDEHSRYCGIVTARAVADTLADGEHDDATVRTVLEYPTPVQVTDFVDHTLHALESTDGAVPVLDPDQTHLVGWLSHQRLLVAVYRASHRVPDPPPT